MAVHTIINDNVDQRGQRASGGVPKKKLVRRAGPDTSQQLRRGLQIAFFALNLWIGAQFYMFVRYCETAGSAKWMGRPAGVEGWLPIAALMNLKVALLTKQLPSVHPAGMFLLIAFLAISLLMRKAFCSWLCPVGTISEYLWRAGRDVFGRNFSLPRGVDVAFRVIKYLLLSFFIYAVANMPVDGLIAFLHGPYGLIADVKMLNFFRFMGTAAIIVLTILVIASVFIRNFWCRYLCPYGALMGLTALLSPLRIRREESACIDCGKCAKACPAALPVDQLVTIKSAECTGCMECVAVCPAKDALAMTFVAPRRRVPAWAMAAGIAVVFLGIAGWARVTGHWNSDIPQHVYFELVPRAQELTHP